MNLSDEVKERLAKLFDLGKTVVHYGYLPFLLWLGYRHSIPRPSLIKLLSPFA